MNAGDADRPGIPTGQSLLSQVGALFAGQASQIINPKTLLPSMLRTGAVGQVVRTNDAGVAEWGGPFILAEDLGTSGYFPLAYSGIAAPSSFSAVAGSSYLVTMTCIAEDGASGATRNSDFRFHDGTSAFGSVHTAQTPSSGRTPVTVRSIYTATATGEVTLTPEAQCTSGTPAVRAVAMLYTVQPI